MRGFAAGMLAAGMLAALMMLVLLCGGATAQEAMQVYVAEGALDDGRAQQIIDLLNRALPEAQWTLAAQEEGTLRERMLMDRAPALAICAPREALPWAREGLLLPLQAALGSLARVQEQVLGCCVEGEELVLAPLYARHRQLAVNKKRLESYGLGYMLDPMTYPVWYPAQFYQILEEFLIRDETGMDVWLPEADTGAAIEALVQAIFGGALLSPDGTQCQANQPEIRAGVRWLADAVEEELVGLCESREQALERFLSGETAIFIDWTDAEAARQEERIGQSGLEMVTMPYPTAYSMPVRSFELTCAAAIKSGDAARDALAVRAAALLYADEQKLFGSRAIWQDQAVWLWSLDAYEHGATLRSLLHEAIGAVVLEGADELAALERVQAAMDACQ